MKISFNPDNYGPPLGGIISSMSWGGQEFLGVLNQMFAISPREEITELVVQSEGIKVVIRQKMSRDIN